MLAPSLSNWAVIDFFKPDPSEINKITEATPIIIPSEVKNDLTLFVFKASIADEKISDISMGNYPAEITDGDPDFF